VRPRALWFVALCALPATARAQQPEEMPAEVVLGFNPAENAQTLQRSADEIASLLSERIHLPVRASVTLDYTTLVESMRSGHVHVAWLTPSPLVLAERLFGVRVLLTQVRRGKPTYFSAVVVREDSRFHTLEDLRGGSVAWIDPTSTLAVTPTSSEWATTCDTTSTMTMDSTVKNPQFMVSLPRVIARE
jgi:phosphonate transport system substrate-binding protein